MEAMTFAMKRSGNYLLPQLAVGSEPAVVEANAGRALNHPPGEGLQMATGIGHMN